MSTISRRLTRQLLAQFEDGPVDPSALESRISTDRYLSRARFEAERDRIFGQQPIIVGHASEVAEVGQSLVTEVTGRSVIVVRDKSGELHAFVNACRHRGTRLASGPCTRKAFVCPYHGWTYGLDGELISIPHEEAFSSLESDRRSLVPVPVVARHGFVWLNVESGTKLGARLGVLDDELTALGLEDQFLLTTHECEREANWKLVVDLFLEGYHIRTLHRDSVYPFFLDSRGALERFGDHIAAVSARRTLLEADDSDLDRRLRDYVTPNYLLFPNTVLVAHPDYVSRLSVYPLSESRVRWVHSILIPERPTTESERAHWQRSTDLIEGQVFQKEDLHMAEEMQRGLATGADRDIVLGKLEVGIGWFHDSLDRLLKPKIGLEASSEPDAPRQ